MTDWFSNEVIWRHDGLGGEDEMPLQEFIDKLIAFRDALPPETRGSAVLEFACYGEYPHAWITLKDP